MISKKQFYLIFFLIMAVVAIMWLDMFGDEPIPIMQIIFAVIAMFQVVYVLAIAYLSYYSEKITFMEGTKKNSSFAGIDKPSHQPIARYARIFDEKDFVWTYDGYNAGIKSSKGDKLFIAPKNMTAQIGKTLVFMGKQRRISKVELYNYIGEDHALYRHMVGGNSKLKVFVPDAPSAEEYSKILSVVGEHPFGADRFDITIDWMKKRIKPIEMSYDELKNGTMDTLDFSKDVMRGLKYNVMEVGDARGQGVPISPSKNEEEF